MATFNTYQHMEPVKTAPVFKAVTVQIIIATLGSTKVEQFTRQANSQEEYVEFIKSHLPMKKAELAQIPCTGPIVLEAMSGMKEDKLYTLILRN
jgi:hypothetical protein